MKSILGSVASLLFGAVILSAATGCKVACDETEKGSECSAKSLTRFDGTAASKSVDYAAGDSLKVDGVYGQVSVQSGAAAGKVEVSFQPFDYQGYDEVDIATREMNDDLDLTLGGGSTVTASATRHDSSNGLGANITVLLPPEFDGAIDINNHGSGPIAGNAHEFDTFVDYVGASTSLNVHGGADLGDCVIKGSAGITSTTVDCGHLVDVRGVSDNLNLTSREGEKFDDPTIVFVLAGVSSSSSGGNITASSDGPIDGTFPASGGFAIKAYAPNNGTVDTGNVPSSCTIQEADPPSVGSKTVNCGTSPIYSLTTNGETDSVFANGNIYLHFQ
jgi:hypothetical protein